MFDIQIFPAKIEQQPIIKQLLELYTYEMTDLADFDIHDNGYYQNWIALQMAGTLSRTRVQFDARPESWLKGIKS